MSIHVLKTQEKVLAPAEESEPVSLALEDGLELKCSLAASSETIGALSILFKKTLPRLDFVRTDIPATDVILTELLNKRGPAAWLLTTDESSASALLELAAELDENNQTLALESKAFDLVLVPRRTGHKDGAAFALFLSKTIGIRQLNELIDSRQVGVILDLDATLLESQHLTEVADFPPSWSHSAWKSVSMVAQPSGETVYGAVARLPNEPHHAEAVFAASWTPTGRGTHSYCVRQRPGFQELHDCLAQTSLFSTYVCSLGRPVYVQCAWQLLDPDCDIIPREEYATRVNSARPEGLRHVPDKTPSVALGLTTVLVPDLNMRFGPLFIADDCPEVYPLRYRDSVYVIEPYKPMQGNPPRHDSGEVLRTMAERLEQYWEHCYGGSGGVATVLATAVDLQASLQAVPLGDKLEQELASFEKQFAEQGDAAWRAISLAGFLEGQGKSSNALAGVVESGAAAAENDENMPANEVAPAVELAQCRTATTKMEQGDDTMLAADEAAAAAALQSMADEAAAAAVAALPAGAAAPISRAAEQVSTSSPAGLRLIVHQSESRGESVSVEFTIPDATAADGGTAADVEDPGHVTLPAVQKSGGSGSGLVGRKREFSVVEGATGADVSLSERIKARIVSLITGKQ